MALTLCSALKLIAGGVPTPARAKSRSFADGAFFTCSWVVEVIGRIALQ